MAAPPRSTAATPLPADHPKMQQFQAALREALVRKLDAEEESIRRVQRETAVLRRERAEKQRLLLEAQARLRQEEERAAAVARELEAAAERRRAREAEAREQARRLDETNARLAAETARRDALRERLNRVLEVQLALEARRVATAGEVAATNTGLGKAEQDFRQLQEEKRLQDRYVDRVAKQLEELELRAVEYQEQTISLKNKTAELHETVREAEEEAKRIGREKADVVQKWSTAVINIGKRDEAINSFSEALTAQELEMKGLRSQISGVKQEIVLCQERHDHLTTIESRIERLCASKKSQVKQTEEMIETTNHELDKTVQTRQSTAKTLEATKEEIAAVEKSIAGSQARVQLLDRQRKEVEERVLLLLRESTTAEKSGEHADRLVTALRRAVDALETEAAAAHEAVAAAKQAAAETAAKADDRRREEARARAAVDRQHADLDRLERDLLRAQADIDKKQNAVDIKIKEKAQLEESRERGALCPLESDLQRVKDEIRATIDYCNNSKAKWLKLQQELISQSETRSVLSSRVAESGKRLAVMSERRRSLGAELAAMEEAKERLARRIHARDGVVARINALLQEERQKYDGAVRALQARQVQDNDALSGLAHQMEELQTSVSLLTAEVEGEKGEVLRAEAELREWEEKVRACRTTKEAVARGKGRDSELEALRGEVNLLRSRAESVERKTRGLSDTLKNALDRREGMVDRAERRQGHKRAKRNEQISQVMLSKKAEDLRNKLKMLCKNEANLRLILNKTQSKNLELTGEVERSTTFLNKVRQGILSAEQETWSKRRLRDRRLAAVLRAQTRAKWYQAVREKKYRVAAATLQRGEKHDGKDDEPIVDAAALQTQNQMLRGALSKLADDFPHLRETLQKIGDLM